MSGPSCESGSMPAGMSCELKDVLEAATEWDQAKRDPGLLWSGTRLAQASEWAHRHKEEVSQFTTGRFLEASRQQAAAEASKARRLRRWPWEWL